MVGYRRIGNVEQHLANASSTTLLHQLRDLWKSPRGTVLRIEALALVAIILSFFLAFFGCCRRWSNRWIVQKGFLAAHVLSLSLGTYSIGLMQSSSVKSEMYPIWAVSLLTLSGCIDQVTSYNGLDYKGPFSKMIFELCLYCGYVLLMSFSTISTVFGNLAISTLSAIILVRGFHRSLALVLPSRIREQIGDLYPKETIALAGNDFSRLMVLLASYDSDNNMHHNGKLIRCTMVDIYKGCTAMLSELQLEANNKTTIEDGHRQERTAAMVLEKLPARFNNNVQAAVRYFYNYYNIFWTGVFLGRQLRGELRAPPHECTRRSDDPWEVLALLWVQTLLYAAPYGDKEAHRQRLSQGGEFITHLWALLYHLGIDSWEHEEDAKQEEETVEREAEETTMRTSSSQQAAGCTKGTSSTTARLRRTRSLPTAGLDY